MSDINNIPDQKAYKPMPINNLPDQKTYKGMCMTPFKFMMMNQFPFIESSLQEMDNYSLMCQIVNILSTVTENTSNIEYNVTGLYNAYVELMNYVNSYFGNLDVQQEVNTKLDQMATDGTLAKIINQDIFSELNEELAHNTNDIAVAQADILKNTNSITNLQTQVNNLDSKLNDRFTIFLGDSYILGNNGKGGTILGWANYFVNYANLQATEYQIIGESGGGFVTKGSTSNSTFEEALQNGYTGDKTKVKYIVVAGGYNDAKDSATTQDLIEIAISNFMTYVNQNFPNAKVYLGMVGADGAFTDTAMTRRYNMQMVVLPAYSNINIYGGFYLNNAEYILKSDYIKNFDQTGDLHHPNNIGYQYLGAKLFEAFLYGGCNVSSANTVTLLPSGQGNSNLEVITLFNNGNISLILNEPEFIDPIENSSSNLLYNQELELLSVSNLPNIRPMYANMYIPNIMVIRYNEDSKVLYRNLYGYFVLHGNKATLGVIHRQVNNGLEQMQSQLNINNVTRIRFNYKPMEFNLNGNYVN